MIIGGSKKEVITNIKKNIQAGELNKKVEVNDPNLSDEEINNYLNNFYAKRKHKVKFFLENKIAYFYVGLVAIKLNKHIKIEGLENIIKEMQIEDKSQEKKEMHCTFLNYYHVIFQWLYAFSYHI